MTYSEAVKEAERQALKWGGTWAVNWDPTPDGEGRWFVSAAGVFAKREIERVKDPLPPGYLESLWQQSEAIMNPWRKRYM